jgi:hypothetical protein
VSFALIVLLGALVVALTSDSPRNTAPAGQRHGIPNPSQP